MSLGLRESSEGQTGRSTTTEHGPRAIRLVGLRKYLCREVTTMDNASYFQKLMGTVTRIARHSFYPGKEEAVAKFLEIALDMARKEPTTINWYALRLSPSTFGVFDTFNDEDGRQKHLKGPIGQALMANAPELFSSPPSIEPVEVLGSKHNA